MKWPAAPSFILVGTVLAVGTVVACSEPRPRPAPSPAGGSPPFVLIEAAPTLDAAASPPPATVRPSACDPPPPGTTSDDESPTIRGGGDPADLVEWLAARGVPRDAALGWLAARYGPGLDRGHAEAAFAYARCWTLHVGDRGEEALVCEQDVPTPLVQRHAVVLVVRNKQPVAVLDVGLGLVALDFPDARWLDLAVAIAPDGKSAELADRAADGTMLVESRSSCLAREAHLAECETKLAAHPDPESLAHKTARGERIAPVDHCMLHRGADGRIAVVPRSATEPGLGTHPAKLHDCAGGRAAVVGMQRELAQAPEKHRAEWRSSVAFFDRACAQRGRLVWKTDRFVNAGR